MDVSQMLRESRRRAGLSQRQLARGAGTSQPAIARYERGSAAPSLSTLLRILAVLGLDLEVVARESKSRPPGTVGHRLDERREALRLVLDRYGATRPIVFGSVARGEDRPGSDLDLLVDLERPTLVGLSALEHELTEALGRKVDLAVPGTLRPEVLRQARSEGVPL